MVLTTCSAAFYGFLRYGEFTIYKYKNFDPSSHICLSVIQSFADVVHLIYLRQTLFKKVLPLAIQKQLLYLSSYGRN
jgi:hypothetical protein